MECVLNEIGPNIWTVTGPDVVYAGAPMHTRMTIVRLGDGNLWIHSPIEFSESVRNLVQPLGGAVCALVAPNRLHHLFIGDWARQYPEAQVFAEPHVQQRIAALAGAHTISNQSASLYAEDIDQVLFSGNRLFQEAVFFHRPSRTLILTDLMINLKTDNIGFLARLFLQFEGVTYPNGGIARLYRWFTWDKATARAALAVIKQWDPQGITFCHGEFFTEPTAQILDREFAWLETSRPT